MKGKGDFTRDTFDPRRHFSAVRLQQGRVGLDADFNEQVDIGRHRVETGAADALGPAASPRAAAGYRIEPTPDGSDLLLFPGRLYAGGILAELEPEPEVAIAEIDGTDRVVLAPEALLGVSLDVGDWVVVVDDEVAAAGEAGTVVRVLELDRTAGEARLSSDVSAHDGPADPRLRRLATYTSQPDLPAPPPLPGAAGWYLLYLDVWRHHVTHLEDESIRELALGGPDTATRERTVAQVRWLEAGGPELDLHCLTEPEGWIERIAPALGTLRARARREEASDDPCIVPAGGGYTRLENQLYRVEIHRGGAPGDDPPPTFKWSRDNGSILTRWTSQDGNRLTVEESGRDTVRAFAAGQWIELTSSVRELHGAPGTLVRLTEVEGDVLTIDPDTATGTIDRSSFAPDPKVRRWDMPADAGAIEIAAGGDDWVALEGGIEVRFGAGTYRSGDYWLIPARTFAGSFAGDLLWPRDEENGEAVPRPPDGVEHRYAKLGLVRRQGTDLTVTDCRTTFPAATELTHFYRAGGDGQEALPGAELPCPLTVAVTEGQWPVAGARVRFETGSGELRVTGGGTGPAVVSITDASGLASCRWTLPEDAAEEPCLAVAATLLDAAGEPSSTPPLAFNARLSKASDVAYDGSGCRHLADAGTVQEALDRLCRNRALAYVSGDGQEAFPGQELPWPLEVRVSNGRWLEPSAPVQFAIVADDGEGALIPRDGAAVRELVTTTDRDGLARVRWRLDAGPSSQRVEARLLSDDGPVGAPVGFNANLSVAREVAFDPTRCPDLAGAGADTVQAALEELCQRGDGAEPGIQVVGVSARTPMGLSPLANDSTIESGNLRAIEVDCSDSLDPASVEDKPSCYVTVEIPFTRPSGQVGAGQGQVVVGFVPLVLDGGVRLERGRTIVWTPSELSFAYLQGDVFRALEDRPGRILARLTIKGNFVWGVTLTAERLYLDGEVFGRPDEDEDDRVAVGLPSGDRRRGGDLEMWFWLVPPEEGESPFLLDLTATQNAISGTLLERPDSPLSGQTVQGRRVDGSGPPLAAFTSLQGRFRFSGLSPGEYEVSASVGGQTVSRRVTVGRQVVRDAGPIGDMPIDRIDGVGEVFRDRLLRAGITRPEEVAGLEPRELARILEAPEKRATAVLANARKLMPGE